MGGRVQKILSAAPGMFLALSGLCTFPFFGGKVAMLSLISSVKCCEVPCQEVLCK